MNLQYLLIPDCCFRKFRNSEKVFPFVFSFRLFLSSFRRRFFSFSSCRIFYLIRSKYHRLIKYGQILLYVLFIKFKGCKRRRNGGGLSLLFLILRCVALNENGCGEGEGDRVRAQGVLWGRGIG